jgi:phospholipase A-2-activating protein
VFPINYLLFLYSSVSLLPNGQDFVSVGEDRTLRVWKGNDCKQVIHLPAMSIWTVATLKNGDIVTGSRYYNFLSSL